MSGFDNDIVFSKNADFSQSDNQSVSESNGLVLNGKLWIGSTALNAGGTHINVGNIVSPLGTLSIGYSSPNITLDIMGGAVAIETITGDSGSISGNNVTIFANAASNINGGTVRFVNSGTTSTLNLSNPSTENTFIGFASGASQTVAPSTTSNSGFGVASLAGFVLASTATENCAFGSECLQSLNNGKFNTAMGRGCGFNFDGSYNILIGRTTASAYTTTESSNIIIGNTGVLGESHVMRLGTTGSGNAQVNTTYIAGIASVSVANTQMVTINTSTGQLGSQAFTSGTVTSVSVTSANGFAGTVATATSTPAITISTSITGILTGNGTAISGSTVTQNGVLVGGATNAVASTTVGSTGQVLQGNTAAAPTYSTATYPSVGTSTGSILRANGTNWLASTSTYPDTNAVSTLLYASSANVMAALATANNGVLITSATGVPSLLAAGSTGQVLTATTGSPASWAAPAASSISITGNSGGALTGASFTFTGGTTGLTFSGSGSTETLTGTLAIANGGTNATSMATSTGIVKYDGTRLVTSATAKIDSSDRYTNTSQPTFLAFLGTTDTNVTGDNTLYTIGSGNALTKVVDQGTNLNTNGTFTAPVAGNYFLQATAILVGGTVINGGEMRIVTTGRTFRQFLPTTAGNTTQLAGSVSTITSMAAGDTATFQISSSDTGGKVDDLGGGASPYITWISGYLVC